MRKLRALVEQLENLKDEQIQILQEIEKQLLTEYIIKIGDIIIEPLLVEAYYYHKDKFPDISVHAAKTTGKIAEQAHRRQQKNFGKLYVHCPKGDGIDICLTDSDTYFLSFLIKNALVNGEWKTQFAIADTLCNSCEKCKEVNDCVYNDEIVLHKKDSPQNSKIIFLPRKGISGKFACVPIAALPLDKILENDFTLPDGYKKQWRTAVYALAKENMNESNARKLVKNEKLLDSQIEEKYWMLAKETLQNNYR